MTLEQRIEKIERVNRKLRLTVLCMAAGLGALLWLRADQTGLGWQAAAAAAEVQDAVPVQKLIRARAIQLVGDKGQVLISLHGTQRGNISTFNDQGKKMVALTGTSATSAGLGAIVTYHPETGKKLVNITAIRQSDGAIFTYDAQTGKDLVHIGSDGSRGGGVNSFDRKGTRYNHIRKSVD
jgi:hypothetical protein